MRYAAAEAERVVPLCVLDGAMLGSPFNRSNRALLLSAAPAGLDAGLRAAGSGW
jgi:hypothetical protein